MNTKGKSLLDAENFKNATLDDFKEGFSEIERIALQQKKDVTVEKNFIKKDAVYFAIKDNRDDLLNFLIENGKINLVDFELLFPDAKALLDKLMELHKQKKPYNDVDIITNTYGGGNNLLHISAAEGYLDFVEYILENNKDLIDITNSDGKTPLYFAVENGRTDIAISLLDKGAKIDYEIKGWLKNVSSTVFSLALKKENKTIIKKILNERINDSNVTFKDYFGYTYLHDAFLLKEHDFLMEILNTLLEKGAKEDARIYSGDLSIEVVMYDTPLHFAVKYGSRNAVEALINHNNKKQNLYNYGGFINAKNAYDETPLYLAVKFERLDIVKYLLESKAQIEDKTLTYFVLGVEMNNKKANPLILALESGNKDIINVLIEHLSEAGVNFKDDTGFSNLYHAILFNRINALKSLIEKGADVNAQITDVQYINNHNLELGDTPLHFAVRLGNEEAVKALLENNNIDLERVNKSKLSPRTAEELAVRLSKTAIHKLIIKRKLSLKAQQNQSPITQFVSREPVVLNKNIDYKDEISESKPISDVSNYTKEQNFPKESGDSNTEDLNEFAHLNKCGVGNHSAYQDISITYTLESPEVKELSSVVEEGPEPESSTKPNNTKTLSKLEEVTTQTPTQSYFVKDDDGIKKDVIPTQIDYKYEDNIPISIFNYNKPKSNICVVQRRESYKKTAKQNEDNNSEIPVRETEVVSDSVITPDATTINPPELGPKQNNTSRFSATFVWGCCAATALGVGLMFSKVKPIYNGLHWLSQKTGLIRPLRYIYEYQKTAFTLIIASTLIPCILWDSYKNNDKSSTNTFLQK